MGFKLAFSLAWLAFSSIALADTPSNCTTSDNIPGTFNSDMKRLVGCSEISKPQATTLTAGIQLNDVAQSDCSTINFNLTSEDGKEEIYTSPSVTPDTNTISETIDWPPDVQQAKLTYHCNAADGQKLTGSERITVFTNELPPL